MSGVFSREISITYSPITEKCKPIQKVCSYLKGLKEKDYKGLTAKIRELNEALLKADIAPSLLRKRLKFLSESFGALLSENAENPKIFAQKAYIHVHQLKNALQVEAIAVGHLFPSIFMHSRLLELPILEDMFKALPTIFEKSAILDDGFGCTIDASLLQDYIETQGGIEHIGEEFDTLMIRYLYNCPIKDGKIYIYKSFKDHFCDLLKDVQSKNPQAKILAQVLLMTIFQHIMVFYSSSSHDLAELIIKDCSRFDPSYLETKQLNPLLAMIMEATQLEIRHDRPVKNLLYKKEFVTRFVKLVKEDWVFEAKECYRVIDKIGSACKAVLEKAYLAPLILEMNRGCDAFIYDEIENRDSNLKPSEKELFDRLDLRYPISIEHPYSPPDKFHLIVPYVYQQSHIECVLKSDEEALRKKHEETDSKAATGGGRRKTEKKSAPIIKCKEKPIEETKRGRILPEIEPALEKSSIKTVESVTKVKASSASFAAPTMPSLAFELPPVIAESSVIITDQLKEVQTRIQHLRLHPRVASWLISKEEGLRYYRFEEEPEKHILSREEMILRHHFPHQVFTALFSDRFAISSSWIDADGSKHPQQVAIAIINNKKYRIEASSTTDGALIHFYARPIHRFDDYFKMTIHSPEEFPSLSGSYEKEDELSKSEEAIDLDEKGNIVVDFEGRTIKILALRN